MQLALEEYELKGRKRIWVGQVWSGKEGEKNPTPRLDEERCRSK